MASARKPWLVALVMGAACVEPEFGIGYGSTGEEEWLSSDSGFAVPADHSYFIAESRDYTDNGCPRVTDLNDTTTTLRHVLTEDGWTGVRVEEGQTTPADFVDPHERHFGLDPSAGDSALLSVYAGHGWFDTLQWGTRDRTPGLTDEERCFADLSTDVRLGRSSGGWARVVLLMTSCTGSIGCYESTLGASDATQVFAFNDSPAIWRSSARRFYRKSKSMASRYAWIRAMDNRYLLTKSSPVAYTRATSKAEALEIHRTARLANIEEIPSATGTDSYVYTWVDHGLGTKGTCSAVPATCVGVDG